MDRHDAGLAPRFPWWWLAAPILVSAAVRDLWAPDEPRYAMIARWIYEHGEFLILRRCGELYPDKPPLVYWLSGWLGWITGWSVPVMRLVSIVPMLAVAWMTERLARRWFGELEARWAPLLFLGFALVFWNAARVALDPLLTLGCVGALYFASAPAASEREASRQVLLAGLCAGIGMFAKGPVALVNFGLPLLLWRWNGLRAPGARASRASLAAAAVLTIGPVLAWALAACLREPLLWRPLFYGQHLERAAEGTAHKGPPWQHLVELPLYLLPWSVPVLLGAVEAWKAWRARRRGEAHDEGLLRVGLWFAALFLFFSIIPAKRELYLLSAYPACALLGARWLTRTLRSGSLAGWVAAVPCVLFAAIGLALLAAVPIVRRAGFAHEELGWRAALAALPFLAGAALTWRAAWHRQLVAWASGVATVWAVGLTALMVLIVPLVDPIKSDRGTASLLRSLPQRPTEIPCYGTAADGVRFYGGGPCVQAENSGLSDGDLERRLEREGDEFLALVEDKGWTRIAAPTRERLSILARGRTGSREFLVLGKKS